MTVVHWLAAAYRSDGCHQGRQEGGQVSDSDRGPRRRDDHYSLRRLAEMADAAWDQEPGPWAALCRFLRGCAELRLGAMSSAIEPHLHQSIRAAPELTEIRQKVIYLVDRPAGAHAEGALRPDIGSGDVATLMTVQVYTPPHMSNGQATRRVVEIMLDGLRSGPPLGGSPVTTRDVHPGT
jgi:hypothetical protein